MIFSGKHHEPILCCTAVETWAWDPLLCTPKQPLITPHASLGSRFLELGWREPRWFSTALGRSNYSCVGFSIQDSFHLIHVFRPDAHVNFLGRVGVGELAYCFDLDHG